MPMDLWKGKSKASQTIWRPARPTPHPNPEGHRQQEDQQRQAAQQMDRPAGGSQREGGSGGHGGIVHPCGFHFSEHVFPWTKTHVKKKFYNSLSFLPLV